MSRYKVDMCGKLELNQDVVQISVLGWTGTSSVNLIITWSPKAP